MEIRKKNDKKTITIRVFPDFWEKVKQFADENDMFIGDVFAVGAWNYMNDMEKKDEM